MFPHAAVDALRPRAERQSQADVAVVVGGLDARTSALDGTHGCSEDDGRQVLREFCLVTVMNEFP